MNKNMKWTIIVMILLVILFQYSNVVAVGANIAEYISDVGHRIAVSRNEITVYSAQCDDGKTDFNRCGANGTRLIALKPRTYFIDSQTSTSSQMIASSGEGSVFGADDIGILTNCTVSDRYNWKCLYQSGFIEMNHGLFKIDVGTSSADVRMRAQGSISYWRWLLLKYLGA